MTNDALRTILPIAGWSDERARAVDITGGTDPILPTPFRIGETERRRPRGRRPRRLRSLGPRTGRRQEVAVDTRQATASLRSGHYMQMDGARGVDRAQHGDGHLPGQERPLELSPLQFPEPSRRRAQRARRAGGSRGGAPGGGEVGRARARGGDHRREGRRRHGAHDGRMGEASAGRRDRLAAADGDRQDRRELDRKSSPTAIGRCRASGCST